MLIARREKDGKTSRDRFPQALVKLLFVVVAVVASECIAQHGSLRGSSRHSVIKALGISGFVYLGNNFIRARQECLRT